MAAIFFLHFCPNQECKGGSYSWGAKAPWVIMMVCWFDKGDLGVAVMSVRIRVAWTRLEIDLVCLCFLSCHTTRVRVQYTLFDFILWLVPIRSYHLFLNRLWYMFVYTILKPHEIINYCHIKSWRKSHESWIYKNTYNLFMSTYLRFESCEIYCDKIWTYVLLLITNKSRIRTVVCLLLRFKGGLSHAVSR